MVRAALISPIIDSPSASDQEGLLLYRKNPSFDRSFIIRSSTYSFGSIFLLWDMPGFGEMRNFPLFSHQLIFTSSHGREQSQLKEDFFIKPKKYTISIGCSLNKVDNEISRNRAKDFQLFYEMVALQKYGELINQLNIGSKDYLLQNQIYYFSTLFYEHILTYKSLERFEVLNYRFDRFFDPQERFEVLNYRFLSVKRLQSMGWEMLRFQMNCLKKARIKFNANLSECNTRNSQILVLR